MMCSNKPAISVCAVRTGAGKSPVARKANDILGKPKRKAVIVCYRMSTHTLVNCEAVVPATLTEIRRIIQIDKSVPRVSYEIEERKRARLTLEVRAVLSARFNLQSS